MTPGLTSSSRDRDDSAGRVLTPPNYPTGAALVAYLRRLTANAVVPRDEPSNKGVWGGSSSAPRHQRNSSGVPSTSTSQQSQPQQRQHPQSYEYSAFQRCLAAASQHSNAVSIDMYFTPSPIEDRWLSHDSHTHNNSTGRESNPPNHPTGAALVLLWAR